ncbi:MAG: ABC transporter ATP-binding protein [Planctomycetota bacterium]
MMTILAAENLRKAFREASGELEVLKGVNLAITRGEILAVQGTSGAGKSTLLHILGGLDTPTSGRILLEDRDIARVSARERSRLRNRRFGFVFQFFHLLPDLSVVENVEMPLRIGGMPRRLRRMTAKRLLDRVGLSGRAGAPPRNLSGGEKQRAAIARALVAGPDLVFCDEPTGNLDSATSAAIYDLLAELNGERGVTFVIATHDAALARRAHRVVRIADGVIAPGAD